MIWVDILMTTLYSLWHCIYGTWVWPTWSQFQFLQGLFLSWNQFCYSSLLCEFRISHFGSFLWLMLQFLSTIGISLTFVWLCWIAHVLCNWWPWKFCCVENFPMASEGDKIDCRQWLSLISKIIWCVRGALCSYDFPERFVWQRDLHFYPSVLGAGRVLSSWSGQLLDLRDPYLCNRLTDFLCSKFCKLSRPVIVHCHGHLPICPKWACPWTKNLSNLAQIGSRLCRKQISGTAGWI